MNIFVSNKCICDANKFKLIRICFNIFILLYLFDYLDIIYMIFLIISVTFNLKQIPQNELRNPYDLLIFGKVFRNSLNITKIKPIGKWLLYYTPAEKLT